MVVAHGLLALILSAVATIPLARGMQRWAPRWGLIDAANARKPHRGAVPIGGLSVVAGSVLGLAPFIPLNTETFAVLAATLGAALLGALDDRWELSAWAKLGGQALVALVPLLGGVSICAIGVLGLRVDLGLFSTPVTLLWLVGLTNAFNLMDGLDGVACGGAVVLALAGVFMSVQTGNDVSLVWAGSLLGAAGAFLMFNTHPARLFLGDGGSYYLGMSLAVVTVAASGGRWDHLEIPFGALVVMWGYPVADTLWAIVRRARARRPIFAADRAHLHHRWLRWRGDYQRTVWELHGLFIGLAVLGLLLFALFGSD